MCFWNTVASKSRLSVRWRSYTTAGLGCSSSAPGPTRSSARLPRKKELQRTTASTPVRIASGRRIIYSISLSLTFSFIFVFFFSAGSTAAVLLPTPAPRLPTITASGITYSFAIFVSSVCGPVREIRWKRSGNRENR